MILPEGHPQSGVLLELENQAVWKLDPPCLDQGRLHLSQESARLPDDPPFLLEHWVLGGTLRWLSCTQLSGRT